MLCGAIYTCLITCIYELSKLSCIRGGWGPQSMNKIETSDSNAGLVFCLCQRWLRACLYEAIYTSSCLGPTDTSVQIKTVILCHVNRARGSIVIILFCRSELEALEMWVLCHLWIWHKCPMVKSFLPIHFQTQYVDMKHVLLVRVSAFIQVRA